MSISQTPWGGVGVGPLGPRTMQAIQKLQARSTEAATKGNYRDKGQTAPPQDITAHVTGNAYIKFLLVWENTPVCPHNQALTEHLCRVMRGCDPRCPQKSAIPLAETACSDITPLCLNLYPKRDSFGSRNLLILPLLAKQILQGKISWPFTPYCELYQLR